MGKEEMGVMLGLLVGEHGGLHLVLVGGLVIVECGLAETGGRGTVEVELALGDTGEVDELEAVELVADLQGEARRGVYDIEGLGKASTMDGELEELAIDIQARHDVGRADGDAELRENACRDDIRIRQAEKAWLGLSINEHETFGVGLQGAVGEDEECEVLEAIARNDERRQGGEEVGLEEEAGVVLANVEPREDDGAFFRVGVFIPGDLRHYDEVDEHEIVLQHVALDDGADVVECGVSVIWVKRGAEGGVSVALHGDVNGGGIGGDVNLGREVGCEGVFVGRVIDFEHSFLFAKLIGFANYIKDCNDAIITALPSHGS